MCGRGPHVRRTPYLRSHFSQSLEVAPTFLTAVQCAWRNETGQGSLDEAEASNTSISSICIIPALDDSSAPFLRAVTQPDNRERTGK